MSENDKDKDFEFIKEQVIEKKRKKIKKLLFPTITTIGFAVLFGVTATITFVVLEPKLSKMIHKEEETVTPVCFPTTEPGKDTDKSNSQSGSNESENPTPSPVIVKQSIDADVNDYLRMNDDIKDIAYGVNKSIVDIVSTFPIEDSWFGKSVDKTVSTTGVIIYNNTKDLLVLVSLDRVKNAKSIKMVFSENVTAKAFLQDYDSEINLAVLAVAIKDIPEIYRNNLQTATLGESYSISVGTPVLALGSPNGYPKSMGIGIITSEGSSVSVTDNGLDLFNTDIEDNENSDGIIVNLNGDVIGLMTRTLKEDKNESLNTAIGISKLKPILERMCNNDPHIYFGVKTDNMTTDTQEEYNISNGIYVNDVQSDSPAFDAGMQKGDIILKINDAPISNSSDFNRIITEYSEGNKLNVTILRSEGSNDKEITLKVTLEEISK